jgi:hypothetical protein
MTRTRIVLAGLVALVVCLGLGYAWGASGRGAAEDALADAQRQLDLAEGRGRLLDARVNLYNMNFGDATRNFENAKDPLRRASERYRSEGRGDAASDIDTALQRIDEAQRLSGQMDQAANSKAAEALDAIGRAAGR